MQSHPTTLDIDAAERRLEASRRETRERIAQLRASVRTKLARPSTLACIFGVGAMAGLLVPRLKRRRDVKRNSTAAQSAGGLVASLIVRYAWPRLSQMLFSSLSSHPWAGAVQRQSGEFPAGLH